MDGVQDYVIAVVTAAMICGIVSQMLRGCAAGKYIKLVAGLFLAVTVLRPIATVDFTAILDEFSIDTDDSQLAVSEGEKMARRSMYTIIKNETEAYILDKAAELNADITVKVSLCEDDPVIPATIQIGGDISPYAKQQLQYVIQTQLGIAKENQQWTGRKD